MYLPTFYACRAIDQGTTSSRFILFDKSGSPVASHQVKLPNTFPKPGWQEQDPKAILSTVEACIAKVTEKVSPSDIVAVGITNQRETLIAWDRVTGEPLHNAIVWCDLRTADLCSDLEKKYGGKDAFRSECGLPISTYFSATKLRWLLDNSPAVKSAADSGRAMFGTVDSWLVWNLSGGAKHGGVHVTDVSNASRTMLMSLETKKWSPEVCSKFGVSEKWLPEIRSCSEVYAKIASGPLRNVPISGVVGDQQAALLGQLCVAKGQAKNTYGTGCFLLMHTGNSPVASSRGLLSTVAYQLGPKATCQYALEGSVAVAGAALSWLQDSMHLVDSPKHFDELVASVPDNGGVYFVPAFSGLLSPHWRDDARGTIVGLTRFANRGHVCRATLEASAFQTMDVIAAMQADSGIKISLLKVDGGLSRSDVLCQFQSDVLGIPVERPFMDERTALGAAFAAGLAEGVGLWSSLDDIIKSTTERVTKPGVAPKPTFRRFEAHPDDSARKMQVENWNKAIERSLGWVPHKL